MGARELRDIMARLRWTSAQLAAEIGVSAGAVRQWTSGARPIPPAKIEAIKTLAAAHGISPAAVEMTQDASGAYAVDSTGDLYDRLIRQARRDYREYLRTYRTDTGTIADTLNILGRARRVEALAREVYYKTGIMPDVREVEGMSRDEIARRNAVAVLRRVESRERQAAITAAGGLIPWVVGAPIRALRALRAPPQHPALPAPEPRRALPAAIPALPDGLGVSRDPVTGYLIR